MGMMTCSTQPPEQTEGMEGGSADARTETNMQVTITISCNAERVCRHAGSAYLGEPAVALEAQLHEAAALLGSPQAADQQRLRRIPVPHQLAGDAWVPKQASLQSMIHNLPCRTSSQGMPAHS